MQRSWLITGVAGFVGSHLLERLLRDGETVTGLDNYFSSRRENLDAVQDAVPPEAWNRFRMVEGDLRDSAACQAAAKNATHVLHQASLVSVPLSVEKPELTRDIIVNGGRILLESLDADLVQSFVYASTSAVYGDSPELPKRESMPVAPLSPYAESKAQFEEIAAASGLRATGLRYFNLYGPRQSAEGGYAAVIPRWVDALKSGVAPILHGDGSATRDFLHVTDAVTANLLTSAHKGPLPPVMNIATGRSIELLQLLNLMRKAAEDKGASAPPARRLPKRAGDIPHSSADTSLAEKYLGFEPWVTLDQGLAGLF